MTKRALFLTLCLSLLVLPAYAQTTSLLDWIPADMQAVVQVDMTNPQATLEDINASLFIATLLQPGRTQLTQAVTYNDLFSLDIFDLEVVSFENDVLPWLGDTLIVAYRQLDEGFTARAEDALLILSTDNPLGAAAELRRVLVGQDLPEQRTIQGQTVYIGDRTSFAFTPLAIVVGPLELVTAALEAQAGAGARLTDTPAFQGVAAGLPDDAPFFAYFGGEAAAHAPGVLLSAGEAGTPILTAISGALAGLREGNTPELALLGGALDGIGVAVRFEIGGVVRADVVASLRDPLPPDDGTFDRELLNWIPRSAMIVQGGGDAGRTLYGALAALPLSGFAGEALAAFPVQPAPTAESIPLPTDAQTQAAVESFLATLEEVANIDVMGSVLDQLAGSYTVAVLPRPNNPTPALNTAFDLLIVARAENAITAGLAADSLGGLLRLYADGVETETLDDGTYSALRDPDTDEPIIRIGTVDDLVVFATGDALDLALRARLGDNRLIDTERWQGFSRPLAFEEGGEGLSYLYVDLNAAYNTLLPVAGGAVERPLRQLAVGSRLLDEQRIHLRLLIGLS